MAHLILPQRKNSNDFAKISGRVSTSMVDLWVIKRVRVASPILGDQFSLSAEDAARGIITIGNPGSGKSSSVILPILYDSMRLRQNLVVSDPQLELRDKIIRYAAITGHQVIIHDPTSYSITTLQSC